MSERSQQSRPIDPRAFDLRRLCAETVALANDCPNGPDEMGNWPCDPQVYFGVAECQVCARIADWPEAVTP